MSLSGRLEQSFGRQLDALPLQTRRLLQIAVADPVGEPSLVWAAAERLGITPDAAAPAIDAGLVELGTRVRFRHPLVRSAAYGSASPRERQEVHRALAEVIDPTVDPDRRAWHRAQATPTPEEDVAAELEGAAVRAQARGGLAAAAAFLERAATLTPGPGHRSRRLLAAARAHRDAGALDGALALLSAIEAGPLDERESAEAEQLRGQIAFDQRRGTDAATLLADAAARLEPIDAGRARETHAEALLAAMWADDLELPGGLRRAAQAACAAPPGPSPPRAVDVLLDAFAIRLTDGYAAAAPTLTRALKLLLELDLGSDEARRWLWLIGARTSGLIAMEVWEFQSWHTLALRQVQVARDIGALVHLQVVMAAATVMRLQTIVSREIAAFEPAVVTIGSLQAGTKGNVIPDEAVLKINVRSFDEAVRARVLAAIKRIVMAEATASGAPETPGFKAFDQFDLTINDPATANHVGDAFRGYFGADRVIELTDPLPVSEDFGLFGQEWKVPSLFWYVGGTDPGLYDRAKQAGRIAQDVPTNHSSKFAPVLHPTLETGIQTLATASLSYLAHQ